MYEESEWFSIDAVFSLKYRGLPLIDEREAEIAQNGRDDALLEELNRRFMKNAGVPFVEGRKFSAFALKAMEVLRIKAQLAREQLEHRWRSPSVAADSIVYSGGSILLVKRKNDPYRGFYALPGGILEEHETLEQCALRELREETGIEGEIAGLLCVFSDPSRDPRVRMISAVYVVRPKTTEITPGDDAGDACFMDVRRLPRLAFDHSMAVDLFLKSELFRQLA